MFLKGKNIALRALEPSDVDLLYRWENNNALWAVSLTEEPFSRFVLDEFVNSAHNDIYTNRQLRLMVINADGTETIGTADLFDFDPQHDRAGIGIYIHEDHRRTGYAQECVTLLKQYAFDTLHLKQLYVNVNKGNKASLALFERGGFEKSGLKKSWCRTGLNSYEDVWFMQCLNPVE
jgi:diamine N-acetyltransferase